MKKRRLIRIIYLKNNSDQVVIVIHEIYGINRHITGVSKALSSLNFDVICPNLLAEQTPYTYTQEEVAYRNFIDNIGFINASKRILNLVVEMKNQYKKVFIIGFSVGATVAWLCSEDKMIDGVVGFYGSRIRDYIEIEPQCPTLLIFPQQEHSFSVDELILALAPNNIDVCKLNGQHGFGDPFSENFDANSAQKALDAMNRFLLKH